MVKRLRTEGRPTLPRIHTLNTRPQVGRPVVLRCARLGVVVGADGHSGDDVLEARLRLGVPCVLAGETALRKVYVPPVTLISPWSPNTFTDYPFPGVPRKMRQSSHPDAPESHPGTGWGPG